MSSRSATSRLIERAGALGFAPVGSVPLAGATPRVEAFDRWLESGYAGEMGYMARTATLRRDPRHLLASARSLLVLGWNYHQGELPQEVRRDPSRGLIASYAWGPDYHHVLKPLLDALVGLAREETGGEALAFVDAGPVLERAWAEAAGVGFIGENTCLIHPAMGSWLFLAIVLLTAELDDSLVPPSASGGTCGRCTRCLDICPTDAFVAPYVMDARYCISYLTIELKGPIPHALRPQMGNWIFGCDLCQQVCPWNRRFASPRQPVTMETAVSLGAPKLLDLIGLTPAQFSERFRGSPLLRSKRRGLLRNVCVALGNWESGEALMGLVQALQDGEPLVRGHAAWALGRMVEERRQVRERLEFALRKEAIPMVRREIQQALDTLRG